MLCFDTYFIAGKRGWVRAETCRYGARRWHGGYADILAARYARPSAGRNACSLLSPLFHTNGTRLLLPRPRYAVVRVLFSRFPRWVRFVTALRRRTASTQSLEGRRRDGHVVIAAKLVAGDKRGISTTRGSPKVVALVRFFVLFSPVWVSPWLPRWFRDAFSQARILNDVFAALTRSAPTVSIRVSNAWRCSCLRPVG